MPSSINVDIDPDQEARAASPQDEKYASDLFEYAAFTLVFGIIGLVMLLFPNAMDGATAGGRYYLVKVVMIAVWGRWGALGCAAVSGFNAIKWIRVVRQHREVSG
ncbi:MAG: hypothetical protein AAF267_01320 [Deinococcota bacterium]